MNKNLLMLCFKAAVKGETIISSTGHILSTWEIAAARSEQLKKAIDTIPDEPVNALIGYFRAKDCLVSDFSVIADLFEATKSFNVTYDELKECFIIRLEDDNSISTVLGSRNGFTFYKDDQIVQGHVYNETMTLEDIIDLVLPFFVEYQ